MNLSPKTKQFIIVGAVIIVSLLIVGAVRTDNFDVLLKIIQDLVAE